MDKQLAEQIVTQDECRCRSCGATWPLSPPHHIKYRSEGGSDDPSNLITVCRTCDDKIHNGTGKGKDRISGREFMISILEKLRDAIDYRWEPALEWLYRKRK